MCTNETSTVNNKSISNSLKFAILMTLEIPSIVLSLTIFFHYFTHRNLRLKTHQHSIFILLGINFIQVLVDIPMPIKFYQTNGSVTPFTRAYCLWWVWFEFSLNTINVFLMAWITIERHIYIFYSYKMRNMTQWEKKLFHILPLTLIIMWSIIFYTITVLYAPFCSNIFLSTSLFCGQPCYLATNWGTVDIFIDVIAPVLIIFSSNLLLITRVIYQQLMVVGRRQINWRNQRNMIIQLGLISTIYLFAWIPVAVVNLGITFIDPTFLVDQLDTINFLIYFVPLILPIVSFPSIPFLTKRIKILCLRRRQKTIVPAIIFTWKQMKPLYQNSTNPV